MAAYYIITSKAPTQLPGTVGPVDQYYSLANSWRTDVTEATWYVSRELTEQILKNVEKRHNTPYGNICMQMIHVNVVKGKTESRIVDIKNV